MKDRVFMPRHFDRSVIILCVRLYLAYSLSLRDLEEMMAERGISADHATVHLWVIRYSPELLNWFNTRKRPVTGEGHLDEMYIEVRGRGTYLCRDRQQWLYGRVLVQRAVKRHCCQALPMQNAQLPWPPGADRDGWKQTKREAILSRGMADRFEDRSRRYLKPIRIRQSAYLHNRIERDRRAIKRWIRPMLGFKSTSSAPVILSEIEMIHMMRKQQSKYAGDQALSLFEQFNRLAA